MRSLLFNKAGIMVAVAVGVLAAGCSHKKPVDPTLSVSGVAINPSLDTLGPGAVAYVRLADVTKDSVQGKTVVQKEFKPDCCGTLPFELTVKQKQIDPKRDYALDIRVVDAGELVYITRGSQPVLTKGNGTVVDVDLERAGSH